MDGFFQWREDRDSASAIEGRIADLKTWLSSNYPECNQEKKHLDEGTSERGYWHYGYLCALRDVLRLVHGDPKS